MERGTSHDARAAPPQLWQLAGELPEEIEQCTFLQTLELQDNQLAGLIPMSLWNCRKLVTLALEGNSLFG